MGKLAGEMVAVNSTAISCICTTPLVVSQGLYPIFSRAIDIIASLVLLIFLAPLLALIVIAVRLTDKGPILFAHSRIGRHGTRFRCLKFRSMAVDADLRLESILASSESARSEWAAGQKLRIDPRLTRIGGALRKTSLDELPQLINVLRGEMSLVGPRPIVDAEVSRYGRYFSTYCIVRPGITGLWQVSGRSDTSYRRRVALDVSYVRAKSLRLDLFILLMTVPRVLEARGSY
jgi:exopolysaccharide production protein ExoY